MGREVTQDVDYLIQLVHYFSETKNNPSLRELDPTGIRKSANRSFKTESTVNEDQEGVRVALTLYP